MNHNSLVNLKQAWTCTLLEWPRYRASHFSTHLQQQHWGKQRHKHLPHTHTPISGTITPDCTKNPIRLPAQARQGLDRDYSCTESWLSLKLGRLGKMALLFTLPCTLPFYEGAMVGHHHGTWLCSTPSPEAVRNSHRGVPFIKVPSPAKTGFGFKWH